MIAPTPLEEIDGVAWGWTGMACDACDGGGRLTSVECGTVRCAPCFGTGEVYGPIGPAPAPITTPPLRIIVCGDHRRKNHGAVFEALNLLRRERGVAAVLHGEQPGVAGLAAEWAKQSEIPTELFAAHWQEFQSKAPARRNASMIRYGRPDLLVAFPGGGNTIDLIVRAWRRGLPIWLPEGHAYA
nr:SLOG family protein [uncultured Roseococcus sp.]